MQKNGTVALPDGPGLGLSVDFAEFKKRLDYSEYGGAVLLGVRGVSIVGHGSSNEKAIMNGIRVASEVAQADVNSGIEAALRSS